MKPHKHAELIKAWADGAEIEVYQPAFGRWEKAEPAWHTSFEYRIKPECNGFCGEHECKENKDKCLRIKPEPKPDVVTYLICDVTGAWVEYGIHHMFPNHKGVIKVISDGQTGKPKSAEVLK